MDFPEIKRKKYAPKIDAGAPFPIITVNNSEHKSTGYFTGCSVEVFNQNDIQLIHKNGVFGKGLLSRSTPACLKPQRGNFKKLGKTQLENRNNIEKLIGNFTRKELFEVEPGELLETIQIEEPLILSLEEAFFLQYSLKCLEICDLSNQVLETKELWIKFCNLKKNFVTSYVTYHHLRSLNWVVRNGFKFGGDFCKYIFLLHLFLLHKVLFQFQCSIKVDLSSITQLTLFTSKIQMKISILFNSKDFQE